MKVLEINAYHSRVGGAVTVYTNTTIGLKEAGHDVVNFTLKWDDNEASEFSKYFPESKDTRKGILRPVKNIATYFYHKEAAKKLEKLIIDHKPDIAQIHLIWGQLSPSILPVLKKYNIPVIFTIHDYRIVCPNYLFLNGYGKVCEKCKGKNFYNCVKYKCCKNSRFLSVMMSAEQYFRNLFFHPAKYAQGIVYVSDFAKEIHEKYMPQLKNIPNIRLYNFHTKIESAPVADKNDYFLFFGRLSREKGLDLLLKTFGRLPNLKLKIVGKGPYEEKVVNFIQNNNCTNIEFVGYKKGEELIDIIRKAYFTVVPSEWYENNPMTIIESYSVGTPVIGASIGGIPEIISENNTGFIFDNNDTSLQSAVLRASQLSPKDYEKMCRNALEYAQTNFGKEQYITKIVHFFQDVMKKNSGN